MRKLYTFLFYLCLPFIFLRLKWKSLKEPGYGKRLGERLGFYPHKLEQCIWIHAVSVGETIAAIPLIKALQSAYPKVPFVVTTMTPTGAERVKSAFADQVTHVYLPYDIPSAINRFLNTIHPMIGIIMETELWPNLIAICQRKQIPLCVLNARLSEKSALGYAKIISLTKEMLGNISLIAAHGKADAQRFIHLGAPENKVVVTGNLKFDLVLPQELSEKYLTLHEHLGKERFIWIAASTHEGEEEIILAAHQKLRQHDQSALLILVPRHPNRFDLVAKMAEQSFMTARRSLQEACLKETGVYLGDTMGELLVLYGAANVAFIGGSLIPRGGHNMLEPGALAKPIITGPHLFNFAEISELFISAQALKKVHDEDSLAKTLIELKAHPEAQKEMGERALKVVADNRGALQKQLSCVSKLLENRFNMGSFSSHVI